MTQNMQQQPLVLVLGGTGKIGRRIVARLTDRGVPVRIGARTAAPAFDWNDPATWRDVLHGVQNVFISYAPDIAVPGAPQAVAEFTQQAAAQGVARVVLLSGRGEPEAEAAERLVQDGPLPWTILRCSWFAQNFSEAFLLDPVLGGEVALPVDGVTEPFVDGDDIAEVAAEALLDDRHAGQVYELTGPRLLTFGDAIREIARAAERPIRFTAIPLEEFTDGLAAAGLSRTRCLRLLPVRHRPGRPQRSLTDGVGTSARPRATRLRRLRPRPRRPASGAPDDDQALGAHRGQPGRRRASA